MNSDEMFQKLESILEEFGNKQLPKDIKMTITYSTGEKEDFNVSITVWANMMVASKNRNKYFYFQNHLINLEHVVKAYLK